jgi:hypothetical protein
VGSGRDFPCRVNRLVGRLSQRVVLRLNL